MRKIIVVFAVGVPLALSALFIVNSIVSDTFPMFRPPIDESQNLQQTYQAGLDYCETNYGSVGTLDNKEEYEKCINSVETWYVENQENPPT
jgi:hypothetical protein